LNDIVSKEEHFGADSFEVGYALTCILQLRLSILLLSLLRRAWTSEGAAGIYRHMELEANGVHWILHPSALQLMCWCTATRILYRARLL
jgi:hypothetical protein